MEQAYTLAVRCGAGRDSHATTVLLDWRVGAARYAAAGGDLAHHGADCFVNSTDSYDANSPFVIVYVLTLESGSNADAMRMELIESGAVEWVVSLQSHRSFMLVCHLASDAKCTQFLGTRPIVKFMVRWISTATLEQVRSDGARALLAIESASAEGQQLVHEHARRCSLAAHLNIGIDPSIPVSKDIKELLARLARGPQS